MTAAFSPIAIVGRACLLPGASGPEELWQAVVAGRDLISSVPADRWGIDPADVLCAGPADSVDRTWSDRGGYVRGFDELFDPHGFAVPAAEVAALDPVFRWTLHTARQALRDAGRTGDDPARFGAVFGNLSFPSAGMAAYTQATALAAVPGFETDQAPPDPRNRFSSGLPALVLERALGLGAGAFALDAACASSLYAVKLACDRLHDGTADLMLAGAVNCADDLCIHLGFTALQALSRTGRSRPFHRDADGLVPAEGCGFVALRRLADAQRDGDVIHGVIRGVGLSNDGRGRGMLVPAATGQARAMRAALDLAGLQPGDVSLLECHATGTQAGDATEIRSTAEIYGAAADLPIGSLKSNTGHLIAAAGIAGLIKVLEAMRHEVRPPTLHADQPLDALAGSPLRLLTQAETWDRAGTSDGVRRAAVSAFGFGGNNAHLIVEEPGAAMAAPAALATPPVPTTLAVVGLGVSAASAVGREAFTAALLGQHPGLDETGAGRMPPIELELGRQRFPPNDLKAALPQQLAVVQVATEAIDSCTVRPGPGTGVYVGMGVDPEAARFGVRWRIATLARERGYPAEWVAAARADIGPPLDAAAVLGTMPNIVANRLNSQFDLGGASLTVSSEERSGLDALDLAARALRAHEIDTAVVAAVDMSCDPVHQAAIAGAVTGVGDRPVPGDAAVALVLKRLADAERDGDQVLALLPGTPPGLAPDADLQFTVGGAVSGPVNGPVSGQVGGSGTNLAPLFGHAHVAAGLLHVAAAALALHLRVAPGGRPLLPNGSDRNPVADDGRGPRTASVAVDAMDGIARRTVILTDAASHPSPPRTVPPRLHVFSGADRAEVLAQLAAGRPSTDGPARLVLVAADDEQLADRAARARRHLAEGYPPGEGVHFRAAPLAGELAFVFTAAGAAYPGMGADLLRAVPELLDPIGARFPLRDTAGWVFEPAAPDPSPTEYLWGTAMLSQAHARLTRQVWGLAPAAAIGYSSGESNSLFAFDVWTDMDAMRREIAESGLMDPELGVEFRAVARAWGTGSARWAMWNVLAPIAAVRAAIAGVDRVHLAIVNGADDVVIGGDAAACEQVVATIGRARCRPVDYNLACHVPEVATAFHQPWRDIHTRAVTPMPGVRYYSNGAGGAYPVSTEACAEMITRQAETTLDFPATVRAAYADGVRIFLEHGPGGACTQFIREILAGQDILAVALDRRDRGVGQLFEAAAALVAAGVPVDHEALAARLTPPAAPASRTAPAGPMLSVPTHRPPVRLPAPPAVRAAEAISAHPISAHPASADLTSGGPANEGAAQWMAPAPALPPVHASAGPVPAAPEPIPAAAAPEPAPARATVAPAAVAGPAAGENAAGENAAAATIRGLMAQLTAVHDDFLRQQSTLHTQFLATRVPGPGGPRAPLARATAATPPVPAPPALVAPAVTPPPVAPPPITPPPVAPVPAAPPPAAPPPVTPPAPTSSEFRPSGPVLDRVQLTTHSSGRISELFGPLFEAQDGYRIQCRMPEPPLLLADGVDGIDAPIGVLGEGVIWTHTDVRADSWYLNGGVMPAGFMIESGQADLMLISYMGIDLLNRGERAYRLLGCTLTYHADLPVPGERLEYEIRITGHARYGAVRLFFFEYDCRSAGQRRLTVRGGQAGFFSPAELRDAAGVLWTPEDGAAGLAPDDRVDPPAVVGTKNAFDRDEVQAFSQGRVVDCFGPGFEWAHTHTRTPTIQSGDQLFLDRVTRFEPSGGPWGRGFLRCETTITGDEWFFDGHFKNDPCMPGNFMVEACIQALSFYLAALGFTTRRDGWRFQPLPEQPFELQCRGEVNRETRSVAYELHVSQVWSGPRPTVIGDVIGFVDGKMAFHAHRIGVELTPGWPLDTLPDAHRGAREGEREGTGPVVATDADGFAFDYPAMLACAWGRPTDAFGSLFADFDTTRRPPRLPGPPYHFISRIAEIQGRLGHCEPGLEIVADYDIPDDAWYFDANGAQVMPFAVLLEAALQPCGWVATAVGSTLGEADDQLFRNLDGTGTLSAELTRTADTLRTQVRLTSVSRSGGTTIESFEVQCLLGERPVYRMETVFGFFPPAAFENQVGLPITDEHRRQLADTGVPMVDLTARPERYCAGSTRLADPMLLMLDRAVHLPGTGAAGLGIVRGEKDVDPAEWFFKAHFFQDPVQPGSLGIEALLQLLQFFLLDTGAGADLPHPRFEPMMLDRPMTWKYRGQVTPAQRRITTVMEITEVGTDERGAYVVGAGSLWCDGLRIYQVTQMGMRLVPGPPDEKSAPATVAELSATDLIAAARDHWERTRLVPGRDLVIGLIETYVNRVVLSDATRERLRGRSVIFVANHQVQIESIIIGVLLPALTGVAMTTVANAKHEHGWVGQLVDLIQGYPGASADSGIAYYDQTRPAALLEIVDDARARMSAGPHALFLHVEGTRARQAGEPVTRCSSVLLDLALDLDVAVVPVRFTGGLPVRPVTGKADFPIGHGAQDYWIGEPIEAAELAALPLRERVRRVVTAINALGGGLTADAPAAANPDLADRVDRWQRRTGAAEAFAVARQLQDTVAEPGEDTMLLRMAAQTGGYASDGTPRGDWLAAMAGLMVGPAGAGPAAGPPLPERAGPAVVDRLTIGRSTHPHLADHAIDGQVVVPVAYAVQWLTRGARAVAPGRQLVELAGITLFQGVVLGGFADGRDTHLDLTAEPAGDDPGTVRLDLVDPATGRRHYRGTAILADHRPTPPGPPVQADPSGAPPPYGDDILFHGPAFQMIESVVLDPAAGGMTARLRSAGDLDWPAEPWRVDPAIVDPAIIDGALQLALLWTRHLRGRPSLPTGIERIRMFGEPAGGPHTATLAGRSATSGRVVCDVVIRDGNGVVVLELLGVETHVRPVPPPSC